MVIMINHISISRFGRSSIKKSTKRSVRSDKFAGSSLRGPFLLDDAETVHLGEFVQWLLKMTKFLE